MAGIAPVPKLVTQQLFPAFGIRILEYSPQLTQILWIRSRYPRFSSNDFWDQCLGSGCFPPSFQVSWSIPFYPKTFLDSQEIPFIPEHSQCPRPGSETNPNNYKTVLEHFIFQAQPNSLNSAGKILGAGLGLGLSWEIMDLGKVLGFQNSRGLIWRENLWNRRKRK